MDITQGAPFESFGLSEATMRAIHNKGYEVSTPVQAGCIPPMLAGKDVIAKDVYKRQLRRGAPQWVGGG